MKHLSKSAVLWLLIAVLFLFCACQPTPEEDAVRQKDSVKMIEMAIGDVTETQNGAEAQTAATPIPVREQVPERLVWDFYTDVENVHVVAEVPIRIMTEDSFPLLRVEPRRFKASDNLAVVQAKLGRLEEAETNALRALSRLPDSKEVNSTLKAIRKRLAASDAVSRKKKIHNKKEGANK